MRRPFSDFRSQLAQGKLASKGERRANAPSRNEATDRQVEKLERENRRLRRDLSRATLVIDAQKKYPSYLGSLWRRFRKIARVHRSGYQELHYGQGPAILEQRAKHLATAYAANPQRFVKKMPTPLPLPQSVYINPGWPHRRRA